MLFWNGKRPFWLSAILLFTGWLWGCAPTAAPVVEEAAQELPPTAKATATETAVSPTATVTPIPPTATASPLHPPTNPATATAMAIATTTATATNTVTPSPTPLPPTAPPATPTPGATNAAIGAVTTDTAGDVTVTGTVVATASFSKGYKFTLDDGAGRIVLLMWHNVYDDTWDAPELNRGATVQATGEVGEFEGELQLEPDFGGDVKVLDPGSATAPRRNIGDLGNHMNEMVQIEGHIDRVEGTGSGAKLFVRDDTGEILVFIWNSTLDRIPNNTALGQSGTRVRVVGRVQEYRNNREIVPVLPYDVEVLP